MVLSDLAKGGLESGVWIDKQRPKITLRKESVIFSVQCIIAKTM